MSLIKKLNWSSRFVKNEGYGYFNRKLLSAVNKSPFLDITPIHLQQLAEWDNEHFAMAGVDLNAPLLLLHPPDLGYVQYPGRVWCFTMYESTGLPEGWASNIHNYCERLIVPSQFCATWFANHEVKVPIHIVPGGIDPEEMSLIKDIPDRPYTFMCLGDRGNRKGHDTVFRAFYDEFGDSDDVRLIVKTRKEEAGMDIFNIVREHETDPRITLWKEDVPRQRDVFQVADCFVFPSRGEGYGLPPREAAACGLPVIATRFSGLDDQLDKWALPVSYKLRKSSLGGLWAEPSIEDVRKHMRWCYENKFEAQGFGVSASMWLRKNATWAMAAEKLTELFLKYLP